MAEDTEVKAATAEDVSYSRRTAAARDLILRTLERHHGKIVDDGGHVVSKVRVLCNIAATPTNRRTVGDALRMMEREGLIERRSESTQAYEVTLVVNLDSRIADLVTREQELIEFFRADTDPVDEQDDLLKDCQRAYATIQAAASRASRRNGEGHCVLNVAGVLKSLGMPRTKAKRARYYLKQLRLAVAVTEFNGPDQLWWWSVSDKVLDPDALMELANGENSYETTVNQREERRARRDEDGPHERRYAGATPAVLPNDMCGPVQVRHVAPRSNGSSARTPSPASMPGQPATKASSAKVLEVSQVDQLLAIIANLERQLTDQAAEHASATRKLEDTHARQLEDLRKQLADLRTSSNKAAEVIARYNSTN